MMPAASLDVGPGGRVGVAWTSAHEDGTHNVYFAESADGGANFGVNHRVHPSPEGVQEFPDVAYDDDGCIHVIWGHAEAPEWDYDLHYGRSEDAGVTFSVPVRVNDDPEEETHAQDSAHLARRARGGLDGDHDPIAAWSAAANQRTSSGPMPGAYAVWVDGREASGPNIYAARSVEAMAVEEEPATEVGASSLSLALGPSLTWGPIHLPAGVVSVHDVTGRQVWRQPRHTAGRTSASGGASTRLRLGAGVYFVRWWTETGTATQRVTVLR